MKSFIKENLSLVAALALPVLFAGFFFISKQVGAPMAPPPQHDFVLAQDNYGFFQINITDGALNIRFTYPKRDERGYMQQVTPPELYYVDHTTMIAERIGITLPADAGNPEPSKEGTAIDISVTKFSGKKFSSASISPDGYELSNSYYRSGNLMTEIFAANHNYHQGMSLHKNGARIEIKGLSQNYGLRIIGWVIP